MTWSPTQRILILSDFEQGRKPMKPNLDDLVARARAQHLDSLEAFVERELERLERLARWAADALRAGGKLLFFGNGGSAAQAQHLAAEFVNRYAESRRALAAMALTVDGAVLTSVGNDLDFSDLFARQIEALGRPEDLAVGISTSGASANLLRGLQAARRLGLRTAGLLGRDGGLACREVDLAVVVPGTDTPRIQEVQLFAGHVLCERVEELLGLGRAEGRDAATDEPLSIPAES